MYNNRPYIPILLPSIFSICMGLSLLLSTPLLGVGEGQRGDGGSLSIITMLSKDFARLLDSIFRPVADDEVEPFDSNRAISCSIDRGSTVCVEIVYSYSRKTNTAEMYSMINCLVKIDLMNNMPIKKLG